MERKDGRTWGGIKLWSAAAVVILGLILVFLFDFSYRVNMQVTKMAGIHLEDIGMQSARTIEMRLENAVKEVEDAAFYLSELGGSEVDKSLLLIQMQDRDEFFGIRIIDLDGRVYAPDGTLMENHEFLSDMGKQCLDSVLEGRSGISDVFVSSLEEEKIFVVYAPIISGSRVTGGIVGTMAMGQLLDSSTVTGFSGHCYNYVINMDGELIMQDGHPDSLCHGDNYFVFLDGQTDTRSMTSSDIQEKMKEGEGGYFQYTDGKQGRLAYFTPSRINNWYVITAVTEKSFKEYNDGILLVAFYLTMKLAIVFALTAFLILWWSGKTRRMIVQSKEDLELEKKKLELSLRHTSSLIFEFREDLDEFTFLATGDKSAEHLPAVITGFSETGIRQGIVAPEYFKEFNEMLHLAGKGNICKPAELKGGSIFPEDYWFRLSLSVIENDKGHILDVIGTMEDITQEKKDRRLYEQEEQYRKALQSETVASWSVDLVHQRVTACSMDGAEMEDMGASTFFDEGFLNKIGMEIESEEQEKVWKFLQVNHLLAAYYVGNRDLKSQFKIRYPGMEDYRWVSCNISLLSEPYTGNPIAFAYLRDVDEERRRELELTYTSERDPLTGLYNRRNIAERIQSALEGSKGISCLMMMDLDGFKGINDKYGHQEGDKVLKEIARILMEAFRSDDVVVRLGGDEFMAFLSNLPNPGCAFDRAESVRKQVESLMNERKKPFVSISVGLAYAPKDGDNFQILYKHADEALYEAKRHGKNTIISYEF